jgi:hypothetical protein
MKNMITLSIALFFLAADIHTFANDILSVNANVNDSVQEHTNISVLGLNNDAVSGITSKPDLPVFVVIYDHDFNYLTSGSAYPGADNNWTFYHGLNLDSIYQLIHVEVTSLANGHAYRQFKMGLPPSVRYVSQSFYGDGLSESSPANISDINLIANSLTDGGQIILVDDVYSGCYDLNITHNNLVTIGGASQVVFTGDRPNWTLPSDPETVTDVSDWGSGAAIGFNLYNGHLSFENIRCEHCSGEAFIKLSGPIHSLILDNIDGYNIRRLFDHKNSADDVYVKGLEIRNTDVTGFSKQAIRIRSNSQYISIIDFYLNSGRQDGDNFAVGIQIGDNQSILGVSDVFIKNGQTLNSHSSLGNYFNGDGVVSEKTDYGIYIDNLTSSGHTDGGIDLKSESTFISNSHFFDNKRNVRLWGGEESPVVLANINFGSAVSRGGSGSTSQVGLYSTKSDPYTAPKEAIVFDSTYGGTSHYLLYSDGYNVSIKSIDSDRSEANTFKQDLYAYPKKNTSVFADSYDTYAANNDGLVSLNHISDFDFYHTLTASERVTWKVSEAPSFVKLSYNDVSFSQADITSNSSIDLALNASDMSANVTSLHYRVNLVNNPYGVGSNIFYRYVAGQSFPLLSGITAKEIRGSSGLTTPGFDTLLANQAWVLKAKLYVDDFSQDAVISEQANGWNDRSYQLRIKQDGRLQLLYSRHEKSSYNTDFISERSVPQGQWFDLKFVKSAAGLVQIFVDDQLFAQKSIKQVRSSIPIKLLGQYSGYVHSLVVKFGVTD